MKVIAEIHRRYCWGDFSNYVMQTTSYPQKQDYSCFLLLFKNYFFPQKKPQQGLKWQPSDSSLRQAETWNTRSASGELKP